MLHLLVKLLFFIIVGLLFTLFASETANWKIIHPEWIYCDDFETSTVDDYDGGWKEYISYVKKIDNPSNVFSGNRSIQATITPGINSAAGLHKYFEGQDSSVYVRWYAKFAEDYDDQGQQHFVTLQALDSSKKCGCSGCCANTRPQGDDRFLTGLEFVDQGTTMQSYLNSYFYNQRNQNSSYRCCPKPLSSWAQRYEPDLPHSINKGIWYCMELMIHPNTPGKDDGFQKYWINGQLVYDDSIANKPCGPFVSSITNQCELDSPSVDVYQNYYKNSSTYEKIYPAEGYVWRTSQSLKINNIWIQLYNHKAATNPRVNRVWFDNLVVSKKYIGPVITVKNKMGRANTQNSLSIITKLSVATNKKLIFHLFSQRSELIMLELFNSSGRRLATLKKSVNAGYSDISCNYYKAEVAIYKISTIGKNSFFVGKVLL